MSYLIIKPSFNYINLTENYKDCAKLYILDSYAHPPYINKKKETCQCGDLWSCLLLQKINKIRVLFTKITCIYINNDTFLRFVLLLIIFKQRRFRCHRFIVFKRPKVIGLGTSYITSNL